MDATETKDILFFTPPADETGVRRVRTDGGATDVLFNLYTGKAGSGEVISGYWECFAGKILIESYPMDEICFITEGSATLISKGGEERVLHPGDVILIPRGGYSHWVIPERVKKVYFIAR